MARSTKPWDRPNAGKPSRTLSPDQKASAKASAERAGRTYPNLVDNMRAAAKKTGQKATTRKAGTKSAKGPTTKKSAKKTTKTRTTKKASTASRASANARIKDPKGGLTAAGREAFAKSEGAHLKPGVRKPMSEMTPDEMRRKGSWAVRFYGRDPLPPLIDAKGQPTRLALTAHAWGEPVPKTEAAARKIAAKGHRLLERYKKLKAAGRT